MTAADAGRPVSRDQRVLGALFFASGAASLVCQVVWFKQLQFVLSSSSSAVSIVVATFFAGLALGGWAVGRLVDRWRHPVRAYAAAEGLLALLSAVVTLFLSRWQDWIGALTPWVGFDSPLRYPAVLAISVAVLLPPTVLMGATLPILSRHLVRRRGDLGERIGGLYALNTLGACFGCALTGFVLIGWLGVTASALVASAVYAAIAATSLATLGSGASAPSDEATHARSREPADSGHAAHASTTQFRLVLALAGISGFAAIGYEILWFRVLSCSTFATVYAFSAMLSTYLLGLVAGAWIFAKHLAPKRSDHARLLCQLQLLTALGAVASIAMLGEATPMRAGISAFLRDWATALPSWSIDVLAFQLTSLLCLLVPATLLGTTFPLTTELAVGRLGDLGSRIGRVYAVNTAGGVAGSLVCGFWMMPAFGTQWSILALAAMSVGVGLLATRLDAGGAGDGATSTPWKTRVLRDAGAVAAVAALLQVTLGADHIRAAHSSFHAAKVLHHSEGKDGTFVLLSYDLPHTGPFLQLLSNGMSFANTVPHGRRYHAMFGHLPALLHRDPRVGLVICVGTGTTAGSLLLHPGLETLWVVDIAAEPFALAPWFASTNHGLHDSPKARKVLADGRHFLLTTDQAFDVITAEPPPPMAAGVTNLYSAEFYRLARGRLNPGGMFVQWFPMNQGSELLNRIALATLKAEFAHVSLWIPNGKEAVAVASDDPVRIDPAAIAERLRTSPDLARDLAELGFADVESLLATFVMADDEIDAFVGDVPVVTDDRPRLEYHALYDGPKLRFETLFANASRLEEHLATPVADPGRLELSRRVMRDVWLGSEEEDAGRFAEAETLYTEARDLEPTNPFLAFLVANAQYRRSIH